MLRLRLRPIGCCFWMIVVSTKSTTRREGTYLTLVRCQFLVTVPSRRLICPAPPFWTLRHVCSLHLPYPRHFSPLFPPNHNFLAMSGRVSANDYLKTHKRTP